MSDLPNTPAQHAQQHRPWYHKGAVPLGSCIMGIPIYLHWSFFALLLIMLLTTLISNATDPAYWGLMLLLYGPILLVTVIIHEFGHAMMTRSLGGQVGDMVLWPLGGFVICGPVESVMGDFKVALAGPLTHIPQMIFWLIIYVAIEGSAGGLDRIVDTTENSFGASLASQAFFLNLILFVFNLFIPAFPLDGGRCLAAGLITCGMSVLKAAIATAVFGMFIALAIVAWGLVEFFKGSPSGIFTSLIGAWVFMESFTLFKATRPASGVYGDIVTDKLNTHPVFGQRCYQDRARVEAATGATSSYGGDNKV